MSREIEVAAVDQQGGADSIGHDGFVTTRGRAIDFQCTAGDGEASRALRRADDDAPTGFKGRRDSHSRIVNRAGTDTGAANIEPVGGQGGPVGRSGTEQPVGSLGPTGVSIALPSEVGGDDGLGKDEGDSE
jgi:hypothetical protein